jgi:AcrB/AcrD/AcrF family
MWIVRFALQRPYTFVIVAVLIAIFGSASILQTPTDILPDIDIPIVSVIWSYSGLDADDMSKRIIGVLWLVANPGAYHDALPSAKGGAPVSGAGQGIAAESKPHLAVSQGI